MHQHFKRIFILIALNLSFCIYSDLHISFIIPFTKTDPLAHFLRDILVQQFFATCEFILISSDYDQAQIEEIKRYGGTFANIKCILSPEAQHAPALYNEAIKLATMPFVTILKVGDYRDPHHMALQQHELEISPAIDGVYSDYYVTWINQGYANVPRKWYFVATPDFNPCGFSADVLGTHCIWRKSLHEKYGYFMESLMYEYQWEFWNRCAAQGVHFKKIPGIAGNRFLDYFDCKQIFYTSADLERGNIEDHYVRTTYKNLWYTKYDFPEKPFVVIIPSYNNKNWYKRNLDSVFNQDYENYRIIYVDDCSPDNTGQLVREYAEARGKKNKITVIINEERTGATSNIYKAAHLCLPEEIIVSLDGDDWVAHDLVLNHLNAVYQDPNVWLTYGQFQWWPKNVPGFCHAVPPQILEAGRIREYGWVTTALRTYYAGLYQKIKKEDLLYQDKFYSMAGDLAIMFPMVDMAGIHCRFINEILYIYNTESNINDHKVNANQQVDLGNVIREKPKYAKIKSL